MKNLFIFCSLLILPQVLFSRELSFLVDGKKIILISPPSQENIFLSTDCISKNTFSCDAFSALHKIKGKELEQLPGVLGNPGGGLCYETSKGRYVKGKNPSGNTIGLCRFKDGSYTTIDSLVYFASKAP